MKWPSPLAADWADFMRDEQELHAVTAAGGRDDAIHAQVDDHLAVMIHHVGNAEGGHAAASTVVSGDEGILWRDAVYKCVRQREGILQSLNDIGLGGELFNGIGLGLHVGFRHVAAEEVVVGFSNMLDLRSKGTDAFELALGRRKVEFVIRHSFRRGDKLLLNQSEELSIDL